MSNFNPLSAELNFRYPSYNKYLISCLAFFSPRSTILTVSSFAEKSSTSNQLTECFLLQRIEKITYTKIYESQNKNAKK